MLATLAVENYRSLRSLVVPLGRLNVIKGVNGWEIDKGILARGAIIALLDPTLISLGSGRWTFQVLLAIGVSMICMAPLRRRKR